MKHAHNFKSERNLRIWRAYAAGKPLLAIAHAENVSRQRVWQIVLMMKAYARRQAAQVP